MGEHKKLGSANELEKENAAEQQRKEIAFWERTLEEMRDKGLMLVDIEMLPMPSAAAANDPKLKTLARETLIKWAFNGVDYYDNPLRILFNLPIEFFNSKEYVEAGKMGKFQKLIRSDDPEEAKAYAQTIGISEAEMSSLAEAEVIRLLADRGFEEADKVIAAFDLPASVLDSPKAKEAAKKGVLKQMITWVLVSSKREIDEENKLRKIMERFGLLDDIFSSPEAKEAGKEGVIFWLINGDPKMAARVAKRFDLPDDVFKTPEARVAALKGVYANLREESPDLRPDDLIRTYGFSDAEVRDVAKLAFERLRFVPVNQEDINFKMIVEYGKFTLPEIIAMLPSRLKKEIEMAAIEEKRHSPFDSFDSLITAIYGGDEKELDEEEMIKQGEIIDI